MSHYREDAREDRSVLVVGIGRFLLGKDPATGETLWEYDLEMHGVEFVIHRGHILAAGPILGDATLWCLKYPSGAIVGTKKIPMNIGGRVTMLAEGERIYVGSAGEIACFGLDGTSLWHDRMVGKGVNSVAMGFPGNLRPADFTGG